MFLPEDATARQQVRLDISLSARMNGARYVINGETNVQNAKIDSSHH